MGQTPAVCRPECQFSSCRNVDTEASVTDLEVVVRDGEGQGAGYGGLVKQQPTVNGNVTVRQESCIGSPPDGERLQEVQELVLKQWSSHGAARSRLLDPHVRRRFIDYYDIGRKLGEGSFGDVHEGVGRPVHHETGHPLACAEGDVAGGWSDQGRNSTRRHVAVKVFRLSKGSESSPQAKAKSSTNKKHDNSKKSLSFEAERQMLATLEHPHIVRMHECFQEVTTLYIVLELCRGGELYSRLVSRAREVGTGLDEPLSKHLFRQMLYAVGYLHSRNIVHRDIKTENFLLVGEVGTPEADTLKLCDFGTSAILTSDQPRCMENIGTLSYTAPEVYANKGAAVPSDCWSLGVVLYVVLTGTNPFRVPGRKVDREETVRRIRNCEFEKNRQSWANLSAIAKDLVHQLLVLEEDTRMTCQEGLQHSWVRSVSRPKAPKKLIPVCTELTLSSTAAEAGAATLDVHVPLVVNLLSRLPRLAVVQRIALECCAVTASEADLQASIPWRELFLALDTNEDGRLSFQELANGLAVMLGSHQVSIPKLEESIRALDFDSSGAIEWVEWLAVGLMAFKGLGEASEPLITAFRLFDRPPGNGDTAGPVEESSGSEPTGSQVCQVMTDLVPNSGRSGTASGINGMALQEPGFALEDLRFVLSSLSSIDEAHWML